MRLKQLSLIKYGKFNGESLDFPKASSDFHVIVGPNEAGKSTVRNAMLELLFGMPSQTPLNFLHDLSELRLGGVLEGENGEMVFHRARGRTQLRTPTDEKLPDDHVAPLLGGATKEFFEQMFGLNHERLVGGGESILDASKELGRVLFQSAAGIGSLAPVREELEARASELWAKRGSSNEYAQAEMRLKEANEEFKAVHVRTKVWSEAKSALEGINDEITETKKQHQHLEMLRSKLERVRRLAPLLRELNAKEAEIALLGDVIDLPPTAYSDLSSAQSYLAGTNRVLSERSKDVEDRQRERDQIIIDDEVLALSRDIEVLDETRGACVNHPRDLPLRQADVERLLTEAFAAASQLGWPINKETLRGNLPTALALNTVTNLLRDHGALRQAKVGAYDAMREKECDLAELREQFEGLTTTNIPDELRQALSDALTLKNSHLKQRALKTEVEEAQHQRDDALAALGRWRTSVDALRSMDLPSTSRASALQRQEQECISAVESARHRLEETDAQLETLGLKEKHFIEGHKVVTPAEVRDARGGRDEAWGGIKSGGVTIEVGAPALDTAIRLADELVDSQLGTATEAATLQSIREQVELGRADVYLNKEALRAREAELSQFQIQWTELTAMVGLPGIALHDLPDWLTKREAVFIAEANLRQRQRDLEAEEITYRDSSAVLSRALKSASVVVLDSENLASLISLASNFVQKTDLAQANRESIERQADQADRSLRSLNAKLEKAVKEYEEWDMQWQQALLTSKLIAASTTLAQAESAVALAIQVAENLDASEKIYRDRIQTMLSDLGALKTQARHLAGLLDEDLLQIDNWSEVARQLMTRLRKASITAQAAKQADIALSEANARKHDAEIEVADTKARIEPLLKLAGCETVEEALSLAMRSDKHRGLLNSIDHSQTAVYREGDGLTREAIEVEVAEQDPTAVIGILDQTKRDLAEMNEKLNSLVQQRVTAEQKFSAINGDANAATAEAKRQEALAAMGDAAEEFLEIATACRLLKWAIDRYRDQKQGPMLQRAGEIFAQLTLGEFSKLVVDHEKIPPALFARRKNNKQVEVSGLSEGTRDQLYLALRIAALELHLRHAMALPFIADDLFVNFDDGRAKAGLMALRDLSNLTQVVFLTHHEHLLPLVHEVFGDTVNILELHREIRVE